MFSVFLIIMQIRFYISSQIGFPYNQVVLILPVQLTPKQFMKTIIIKTQQPPAKAGGLVLRTVSPDTG
jgi:hypothetical protein